ncbi:hypothetical protein JDM601_3117 [Mycolicibacter sinensis]|uniref:Uncharacterized protein n=1 Tax=Mycolicibacter sinensis (strain JDM601) TaxID=875328 RepID=F5Z302_MYCSD|nr:hypothetical protein [Mycolicibacter sinensis]AEF37117.1 hypothetical protein JDM601_3117 [Mycolicibacter sinensis]
MLQATTHETAFRQMLEDVASMDDLNASWLSVATKLLTFVATIGTNEADWQALPIGEPLDSIGTVQAQAGNALFPRERETLSAEDDYLLSFASRSQREALRAFAIAQVAEVSIPSGSLRLAIIARGIADAIDAVAGETFISWYRNIGELHVTTGSAYPVHRHDPRRWLGGHPPNTQPSRLPTRDLAATTYLRIASNAVRPYNYVLDFDYWFRLNLLGEPNGLIAAVGQPNKDLDEFNIEIHPGPPRSYANHGPKNGSEQVEILGALSSEAGQAGAHLLVMPEYALPESSLQRFIHTLNLLEKRPTLVVSGISAGTDDVGLVVNEAIMVIHTSGMQDRIVTLPRKLAPAREGELYEHIATGSEVRVFWSDRWAVTVLICFDAMNDSVIDQLALFGTNLLLVPALSAKSATMLDATSAICHRTQGFVVTATGPLRWRSTNPELSINGDPALRCHAAFAGPYGVSPTTVPLSADIGADTLTDLWIFAFADRSHRGSNVNI